MKRTNPDKTIKEDYNPTYRKALFFFIFLTFLCIVRSQDAEVLCIENESIRVLISEKGAELQSIRGKISKFEYLWQGNGEYWADRAPIMFPVNVRFRDNEFYFRNVKYDMPKMGIIKESFMTVKHKSNDEVTLSFVPNKEILHENYPFLFKISVRYKLTDNTILNEYVIRNDDTHSMYFALGGHPGFNLSLGQPNDRKKHELFFYKSLSAQRELIKNSLLKDSVAPFLQNETTLGFDDDRIPNTGIFIKDSVITKIGLAKSGQKPYISLILGNFPNVNIWSPPGYPFVCIEPMASHHDFEDSPKDIEKKSHLVTLKPGETVKYYFLIQIDQSL
jgi:galactose mutarotase-like enzyme